MITVLITANKDDKNSSAAGRDLLLREGLRTMGMEAQAKLFSTDQLAQNEDGKPFLPGLPGFRFNLSHSGDYIACAFSGEEVGLDLQENGRTHTGSLRIAKRWFSDAEYQALLALPEDDHSAGPGECAARLSLFYRFWSIKEAYLKYLGCGLRGGMERFLPDPLPAAAPSFAVSCAPDPLPRPLQKQSLEGGLPRGQIRGQITEYKSDLLRNRSLQGGLPRGQIRVLCDDPLLTPAEYVLLPAPEGYTMAVCAARLPREITVKYV